MNFIILNYIWTIILNYISTTYSELYLNYIPIIQINSIYIFPQNVIISTIL